MAQLRMRSLGPGWAQGYAEKAFEKPLAPQPQQTTAGGQGRNHTTDGMAMAVLAVAALGTVRGYQWIQAGELWKTVAAGDWASSDSSALAGWAKQRWQRNRNRVHDPALVREKLSRLAFEAEIEVTAILPATDTEDGPQAGAGAAGAAWPPPTATSTIPWGRASTASRVRPVHPRPGAAASVRFRTLRGPQRPRRARGGRSLAPAGGEGRDAPRGTVGVEGAPSLRSGMCAQGALVGKTTACQAEPRSLRRRPDLRRHHLYVARTRMGKSTLMQHLVTHKLREKAAGRDGDAIIVVDPHADLVADLLGHVPESAHRPGAARRPRRGGGPSRHQPPRHAHLQRPRPHRRLGRARGPWACGSSGVRACSRSSSRR